MLGAVLKVCEGGGDPYDPYAALDRLDAQAVAANGQLSWACEVNDTQGHKATLALFDAALEAK